MTIRPEYPCLTGFELPDHLVPTRSIFVGDRNIAHENFGDFIFGRLIETS